MIEILDMKREEKNRVNV